MRKKTSSKPIIFETSRFVVYVGKVKPEDDYPQYIVENKETRVPEFDNSSLYFARDWALQFTKALDHQDMVIENGGEESQELPSLSMGDKELN